MDAQLAWSLGAAVAAAVGYGTASVMQASGASGGASVTGLLRSPAYLAGLLCDLVAWLLSLVALRHLPLFVVQSVLAGSLAVTAVLGAVVLRQRLRRRDAVMISLLVAALVVLASAGGRQAATPAPAGVAIGLVAGAGLLAVLIPAARRSGPAGWALLAGLAFSGAALAARAVHGTLITQPLTYAVVVFGGLGASAYAQALERGAVTAVTGVLWAVEIVVPTAVGLGVLGDTVRTGWWPATVLALLVVLAATAVLAGTAGSVEHPTEISG